MHAEQSALAEEVRALPERVAAWEERRAGLPPDGRAEAGPARDAWRRDGEELAALAGGMLRAEDPHAPWLDARPGVREGIERAAEAVRETLREDAWDRFAAAAEAVDRQWENTGIEPSYLPRYPEMIADARTLDGHADLPDEQREAVDYWLQYDGEAARLCGEIRDWPGRAEALLGGMPRPDADLDALTEWRENAEPLRDEARAMRAPGGAHARHLDAMPGEAKALDAAARGLDAAAAKVAYAEMGRLMESERVFAERSGGIRYDAPVHGALIDRARALDEEPGLPGSVREAVDTVLAMDKRSTEDRERVGVFLAEAAGAADARRELDARAAMRSVPAERMPGWDGWREKAGLAADEAKTLMETVPRPELAAHLAFFGAASDDVEKKEREIREQIARDEQARAAAEAERRAAEQARAAEEHRRSMERFEAARERGKLTARLEACLREREAHEGPFVQRKDYPEWRSRARDLLAEAKGDLDRAAKLPEDRPGVDRLRGLSETLERSLRADRAELERLRNEHTQEQSRRQDRSQDRGFSM